MKQTKNQIRVLEIRAISVFLIAILLPTALTACGEITCSGILHWYSMGNGPTEIANCSSGARCYKPLIGETIWTPGARCDPTSMSCSMTAEVPLSFLGNHLNDPAPKEFTYSFATVTVRNSTGALIGTCGAASEVILTDLGTISWDFNGNCADTDKAFEITAKSCPCIGPVCAHCEMTTVVLTSFSDSSLCPKPSPDD